MGEFSDFYIVSKMAKKAKKKTSKKKKKGGLPSKYAKMGFKKGWAEYKKTDAYQKKHASSTKKKATKKPRRKRAKTKARRTKKPRVKTTRRKKRARKRVTRAVGSLNAMASKGAYKLRSKKDQMASNWKGARGRMKSNYGALPFGPKTKASYRRGVDKAKYNPPNAKKWERNWKQGVRQ